MIIIKKTIKFIRITTPVIKVDNLNLIHKRTMLSSESKLAVPEIVQQKKLYALLLNALREGPLNQEKLLSLMDMSTINMKLFQHTVTIMFPDAKFPLELVQNKYSKTAIGLKDTEYLSWNDLMAVHVAFLLKKQNIFPDGKFFVYGTPPYDPQKGDTSNNLQAIANTGQKNPDYYFITDAWTRYYDLKTGQYSPMKGHIAIKNNSKDFEASTQNLMISQKYFFEKFGTKYLDVTDFIDNLFNNKSLTWLQKSKSLANFYFTNMHRLPPQTPSMILKIDPLYEHETMSYKYYGKLPVHTESCENAESTYDVIAKIFAYDKSGKLFTHYKESHGVSQDFLRMKTKVILDILSNFLIKI